MIKNTNFILILITQIIGVMGSTMLVFATSLYILDATGSAAIFATIISVSYIPLIVFSPIGGALADRFSKKRMIIVADTISLLLIIFLAAFLFSGRATIVMLGITITSITTISVLYQPIVTSAIPLILDKEALVKANAFVQGVKAFSRFLAPALAGVLFTILGIHSFIIIIAFLFLFSVLINFFLKIPYVKMECSLGLVRAIGRDIHSGFVYITKKDRRFLKIALILGFVLMLYTSLSTVALPYIIRIVFEFSEQHFGNAKAATGLAMVIGGVLATSKKLKKWISLEYFNKWLILLGVVSLPTSTSFFLGSFSKNVVYLVFVSGFAFAMVVFTIIHILTFTTIQKEVPQELIGKLTAFVIAIVMVGVPIGQRMMGFLLVKVELPLIFFTISIVTIILGILLRKTFSRTGA